MEISVIGISHRTAPVELRELFSLPGEQAREFLRAVREEAVLDEALVLDTCNRTEVYVVSHERQEGLEHVLGPIRKLKGLSVPAEPAAFYRYDGLEAVRHLFRVASSLESQIVGEHQILGQVKEAYRLAVEERTAQFVLNRLLHAAFRAGKRVQTDTELGHGSASIAQVAVELAQVVFSSLEGKTVLFVGAGETAQLAARAVMRGGAKRLIVANRTLARAQEAADMLLRSQAGEASCRDVWEAGGDPFDELPIRCPALLRLRPDLAAERRTHAQGTPSVPAVTTHAITLEGIPGVIGGADLVISATAAPEPVLTHEKLAGALRRLGHPLVIIDVAVPRDVDQKLGKLPNVYLHDIDDLNRLVERNLQRRRAEVPHAEAIIGDEVERFAQWIEGLQLTPMIKLLQKHMEALQQAEISRYGRQFAVDSEQLHRFTQSLCQKILHKPLTFLREVNKNGRDGESLQALEFVRRMFDLDSIEEGS
jgi:glutamyl-tRNA reductase